MRALLLFNAETTTAIAPIKYLQQSASVHLLTQSAVTAAMVHTPPSQQNPHNYGRELESSMCSRAHWQRQAQAALQWH